MQNDDLEKQFEKWQLQLRKGVLIYMVLVLLDQDEMYGYALISSLAKKLETDMAEGTIYPLLNRMVRRGIVTFDWRIMGQVTDAKTILRLVKEINRYQKIRINSVFTGHGRGAEFMRKLAEQNHGVFVWHR